MSYILRHVVLPFAATLLFSAAGTWLVRYLAHRLAILDSPGAHKQHERATPTLGGVAVFLSFVIGVLVSGPLTPKLSVILGASGLIVVVGFLDDLRGVNANIKLLALAGATYILWGAGIHLDILVIPTLLVGVITFLWVGLVSSAFNGVDNADGSASGLAAISSVWTFLISWHTWQHELAIVSLVLAGSCLGFLLFNYPAPRATIFLGDSGSLFLGFGLATLTMLGQWSEVPWKAAVIALLLVIMPLFDFLFILIVRGLDGHYKRWDDPIRMCARDHTFHRLRALGLSGQQAVLLLYAGGMLGGALAYTAAISPARLTWELFIMGCVTVLMLGWGMKRAPLPTGAYQ
jgi:UDP-GlcNAc:undecaprenyl-phosphate/decaprenyl-phosphate GlcNAc-1-phosphate transferase